MRREPVEAHRHAGRFACVRCRRRVVAATASSSGLPVTRSRWSTWPRCPMSVGTANRSGSSPRTTVCSSCSSATPTARTCARRRLPRCAGGSTSSIAEDAVRIDTVMVSIDPERDREVVADYVDSFVPGAHAVALARRRRLAADRPGLRRSAIRSRHGRTAMSTSPTPTTDCSPSTTPGRCSSRGCTARAATTSPATSNSCSPIGHEAALLAVVAGVLVAVLPGGIAHADPAEPTDYATEVVGIEPATPTIAVGRDWRRLVRRADGRPGHQRRRPRLLGRAVFALQQRRHRRGEPAITDRCREREPLRRVVDEFGRGQR